MAGCFTGWFLATKLGRSAIQIGLSPGEGGGSSRVVKRVTSRVLEVKCQCGAVHKFREGAAASDPSFKPFPKGDTFTCPACGRDFNLLEARNLAQQAGVDLGAR